MLANTPYNKDNCQQSTDGELTGNHRGFVYMDDLKEIKDSPIHKSLMEHLEEYYNGGRREQREDAPKDNRQD